MPNKTIIYAFIAMWLYALQNVVLEVRLAKYSTIGLLVCWYFTLAPLGLAAFRNAPHPHAAILFMDFLLGEGQQLVAAHKMIPTNIKLKPLPAGLTLHLLDVPKYVNENRMWVERYRTIFNGRR